jgi:hypothetical protein
LLEKNEEEIHKEVEPYFASIHQFVLNFVVHKQKIHTRHLDEIIGIEKSYNSQVLGIRGNIDILCATKSKQDGVLKLQKMQNVEKNYKGNKKEEDIKILTPIELKTGSRSAQNVPDKFQVLMYFLMIMDQMRNLKRTDEAPFAFGLLVYLKTHEDANKWKKTNLNEIMHEISFVRIDFVNLFVKRNLLAKSKIVNL